MAVCIRHIITIECPTNMAYKALTTKIGIQGWWTIDTVFKPKNNFTAEFNFGYRYHNKMVITDLQLNKRVAWYCKQGHKKWTETDFTIDLEDKERHTILHFRKNNWRELTDFYTYCNFQWGQYMVNVKVYCETGKGSPFKLKDDDDEN